jgi:hypothetical protein
VATGRHGSRADGPYAGARDFLRDPAIALDEVAIGIAEVDRAIDPRLGAELFDRRDIGPMLLMLRGAQPSSGA